MNRSATIPGASLLGVSYVGYNGDVLTVVDTLGPASDDPGDVIEVRRSDGHTFRTYGNRLSARSDIWMPGTGLPAGGE